MFKTDNSFHACMVIMLRGTYRKLNLEGGGRHMRALYHGL